MTLATEATEATEGSEVRIPLSTLCALCGWSLVVAKRAPQRLLSDHMLNSLSGHRLGTFDADELVAYREQRPTIVFSNDHFRQYEAPAPVLHEVKDAAGASFLLLTGPEPGLRWERMAEAVAGIIDRHDVELTVFVQSMPMPVPHTRPVLVSRWASSSDLIPGNKPMFGTVTMSASFPVMLAQRLGEGGHDVVGLTAHVPHYLAEHDFPDAAITLVEGLREVAALSIPTVQLAIAAGVVRAQIGHQVEGSEELAQHVTQLETQFDEFTRQRELAAAEEELPSAEEIGDAAEQFLKTLDADAPDADPAPG